MKGDIYRKMLIAHLFFDVIAIPAMCMIFCPARNQAAELRALFPTPELLCYPPELNGDPDEFTVNNDDHFGPV